MAISVFIIYFYFYFSTEEIEQFVGIRIAGVSKQTHR